MATWGGSTVDNLESIEEDENGSGAGQGPEEEEVDDGRWWLSTLDSGLIVSHSTHPPPTFQISIYFVHPVSTFKKNSQSPFPFPLLKHLL